MKSVQVKAIHVYLKEKNVQKAIFYWNNVMTQWNDTEMTQCTYQKQSTRNKIKNK